MTVAFALLRGEYPWPSSLIWSALPGHFDDLQGWLLDERTAEDRNVVFAIFDGFRALADWLVTSLTDALEWLTWIGTAAAGVLLVWRFGGWRAGLTVLAAFVAFALMGLWEPAVQTLALMLAAVILSLAIGVPVGVWAGRNARVHRALTPVLDAMQIVPAFAYLMPVVILFSVGPAAAVICTMIYAVPPAVRITALGIRGVTADTVEASQALGATPLQTLFKVQLPLVAQAAPARRQPDDHVRALARRDRRPDRRSRTRRRRHQRPVLERRARAAGRRRDRGDGDRAGPLDRRDRRAHRPDAPPPHRCRPPPRPAGDAGVPRRDRR